MNKTTENESDTSASSSSEKKLTLEELCKEREIPYRNTTEEHIGQGSAHFLTHPRRDSDSETLERKATTAEYFGIERLKTRMPMT
jgi:hypothetical protein